VVEKEKGFGGVRWEERRVKRGRNREVMEARMRTRSERTNISREDKFERNLKDFENINSFNKIFTCVFFSFNILQSMEQTYASACSGDGGIGVYSASEMTGIALT
jgi:hypothetical protein